MGVQTGVGTGTRRCRPPATAYQALRGCWHHGARWTSWTSSGCRRTVGLCSLFGGRTTSPRPAARDQRREVEKRESRGRVPRYCPHDVARHRRTVGQRSMRPLECGEWVIRRCRRLHGDGPSALHPGVPAGISGGLIRPRYGSIFGPRLGSRAGAGGLMPPGPRARYGRSAPPRGLPPPPPLRGAQSG